MFKNSKSIVFFDLETTGTDVDNSRIVQIACIKVNGDLSPIEGEELKTIYINPGVPIPKEASDVHGIDDEQIKDCPPFSKYAKAIFEYFFGCDIAGYNSTNFDIPLISEEFARCGITFPMEETKFFDAYQIFCEMVPRTLSGAVKYYLGEVHEEAHDAGADIRATLDVFKKQLQVHEQLKDKTADEVHRVCQGKHQRLDLAGKIILVDGNPTFNFGKNKGKRIGRLDPYGIWMLSQGSFSKNTKDVVKKIIYAK